MSDELLNRAEELQKNMFFRKMTLTDNGTVSLLIERINELERTPDPLAVIDEVIEAINNIETIHHAQRLVKESAIEAIESLRGKYSES